MADAWWLWIDRLRDVTGSAVDLGTYRGGQDLASDLVHIVDDLLEDPEAASAVLGQAMEPLSGKSEALSALEPDAVLVQARDMLLDLFGASEEG